MVDARWDQTPATGRGHGIASPDGDHILTTALVNRRAERLLCAAEAETPLYYARREGSSPVRLFADQSLGRAFPAPRFSPDGTKVAWEITTGPTLCQPVTALPDTWVAVWGNVSARRRWWRARAPELYALTTASDSDAST
jgi:hypothetical protein